jgi:hypothetical protein
MPFRNPVHLTFAFAFTAGVLRAQQPEEVEIQVGRSAARELRVASDFTQPVELPVSIFPGIPGYATGEVAFHSTILDDPTNDLFQLSTAADLRFVLLAKDPGMEVWNDTGSGYMATNETYFIGVFPFDNHPIWNIVNGTPGNTYSLSLKLRDVNGVYSDSAPFVLSFTPVPDRSWINIEPADPLHATLSWPTNAIGWELQSAASLTATNWTPIRDDPGIAGTNFALSISTAAAQQFFRLHKQ